MYNYTREVGYYILQTNENNGIDGSSILVEIAESKSVIIIIQVIIIQGQTDGILMFRA